MATIAQDETSDLLILSDDSNVMLDEKPVVEENSTSFDDLITFGDEEENKMEEPKMEVQEEAGLDLGFSMEEPKMEVQEEAGLDLGTLTMEEPKMEVQEEVGLDLGLTEKEEPKMEVQEDVNKNVFSLEEATASYVKQLEARKSQIADNISSDEEIIAIKEEKIKNLRSEIADYRNSIKDLNTENDNIDTKIGLVTGNNKASEIQSTTSTRVHNVKRRKA